MTRKVYGVAVWADRPTARRSDGWFRWEYPLTMPDYSRGPMVALETASLDAAESLEVYVWRCWCLPLYDAGVSRLTVSIYERDEDEVRP